MKCQILFAGKNKKLSTIYCVLNLPIDKGVVKSNYYSNAVRDCMTGRLFVLVHFR